MVGTSTDLAAFVGVALLAIVAPFEGGSPLVRLPGQSVTSLEAAVVVAFALGVVTIAGRRGRVRWPAAVVAPWTAFVVVCAIAAAASTVSRTNALHMTGRLAAALGVFALTVAAVTTRARARGVARLVLAGGIAVSILAVLEYLNVPAVMRLLTVFRPGITTVGAQLRAGGPLQYPTIASMYLEIVFAIGVGLLLAAIDERRRAGAFAIAMAILLVAEAIALTYTRAGLVTMAATLAIAAGMRYRRAGADASVRALVTLAAAVVVLFAASRSSDALWLRFTSEGQESWYRADIEAPPAISIPADDTETVPVRATNTGRLVWDSTTQPPFYFSYHWLSAAGDRVVAFEGDRTAFDSPVRPGDTVSLAAYVRAPKQPGEYRLVWDVVQEGRLWFTTEPGAEASASRAVVVGGTGGQSRLRTAPLPRPTVRPGRLQLWRAAAAIVAAHPLLGVGPDNFRLAYGRYAGITAADERTHSNNMYLEVLTGAGLAGAAAFAWLLSGIVRSVNPGAIGPICAVAAIAIHGLVDSFLSFAPTYVLFALTLGLACARPRDPEIGTDAHRV